MTDHGPRWTGEVSFDEEALGLPASWGEPRFVFVDSMSDLFYERFTDVQIAATVGAMMLAPLHVYQVLTKREERAAVFFPAVTPMGCVGAARTMGLRLTDRQAARTYALLPDRHPLRALFRPGGVASCALPFQAHHHLDLQLLAWPLPHLWLGASCNDQPSFDRRAPVVRRFTGCAVRFLSLEPLTGPIVLGDNLRERRRYWVDQATGEHEHTPVAATQCPACCNAAPWSSRGIDHSIDWLIPGGESGVKARLCEVGWIRSILREAATAGPDGDPVAVFVKQLGACAIDRSAGLYGKRLRQGDRDLVKLRLTSSKGEDPGEWPDDTLVQDYPRGVYLPSPVAA